MKIVLAGKSISQMGGMQKVAIGLANEMVKRGHEVYLVGEDCSKDKLFYKVSDPVVCLDLKGIYKKKTLSRRLVRQKFKIMHSLGCLMPRLLETEMFYKVKWEGDNRFKVLALREICFSISPDIAVGFLPNMFTNLVEALEETDIPVVVSNHNDPVRDYSADRFDCNPEDIRKRILAPAKASANTVLLNSFKDFFPSLVQEKTFVIPNVVNGVDEKKLANPSEEKGVKTIICTGRYAPVKDHETLIKSFSLLSEDFKDWKVEIFGQGELEEKLKELVADLGLGDRVFVNAYSDELEKKYAQSHIMAFPSYYEGWGLSLTEAMSHGLPSVGFENTSGVAEIIQHEKTGLLVSEHNRVVSFSNGLRKLMMDNCLRSYMGEKAQDYVKRFSPKVVYDMWESLFNQVVSERAP